MRDAEREEIEVVEGEVLVVLNGGEVSSIVRIVPCTGRKWERMKDLMGGGCRANEGRLFVYLRNIWRKGMRRGGVGKLKDGKCLKCFNIFDLRFIGTL